MGAQRGTRASGARLLRRLVTLLVSGVLLASCTGDGSPRDRQAPRPPTPGESRDDCGRFTIAYDPGNGYEASAFLVGTLAERELGCDVRYVATTARKAWQVVARGRADVYLDAYGTFDLRRRLAGPAGPVTIVGPNGIGGGVDLIAPEFLSGRGLESYRDLPEPAVIGWTDTPATVTTVPELQRLARSVVTTQELDQYVIRPYPSPNRRSGTGDLLRAARADDEALRPNLYLVQGPRPFLGDGPGRRAVEIPGSADRECATDARTTLCTLDNFRYLKIANREFAASDSPAYTLVYRYALSPEEADNILEIVELSGYDVQPADVASWINTHRGVWRRWLP